MHEQLRRIKHLQNEENSSRDHRAETAKRSRHQKPITPTPQSESMHNLGTIVAASLMEPFGALPSEVVRVNSLKDMVGPCGLEPQTSTVSIDLPQHAGISSSPVRQSPEEEAS